MSTNKNHQDVFFDDDKEPMPQDKSAPLRTPCKFLYEVLTEGKKPAYTLHLSKTSSLTTTRPWVIAYLNTDDIGVHVVLEYMYWALNEIKGTMPDVWKSYGVTIPAGEVTPLTFIDVTTVPGNKEIIISNPEKLSDKDDLALLFFICALHRYSQTHVEQQSDLATKIKAMISDLGCPALLEMDVKALIDKGNAVHQSTHYSIFASVLDLFLNIFKNHEFSRVRYGTIIYRYYGCAVLNDMAHMLTLQNTYDYLDCARWLFFFGAASEIHRQFKNPDEVSHDYSYFPYGLGLKLIERSPYSASNNPNFHLVTHVFGSLRNHPRSLNAIMFDDCAVADSSSNGVLLYLAFNKTSNPKLWFRTKTDKAQEVAVDGSNDMDMGPKTPSDWLSQFITNGERFTPEQIQVIEERLKNIKALRDGSVGMWVKNNLIANLPADI
ncbi:putative nucleoprotein [Hubei dimarhabdovirus 1]|uniref:Nucleoprotein n=1 Tax=Hubei dimarhabdovirus 1 TaxID=2849739 RepID=A0A1L3KMV4_9RHAB|nr:putative nucleoprotein [Hubei dimarhabdovirus 1]APG78740.1 putative nucleoprotein [Hubei dimarhabdovirus 1]